MGTIGPSEFAHADPASVRARIRRGEWDRPTTGLCLGYLQANMAILPGSLAADFRAFCERNPRPTPLLEMLEPGGAVPHAVAPGADVRTDLPRYRVYRHGEMTAEPTDITELWREDLVTFLLGCSFTAEARLLEAGVRLRHLELGQSVPMFRTSIATVPAGPFHGPMVVSMRPIRNDQQELARGVTAGYPLAHGAPIHAGDPAQIGIADLARPDWGDPIEVGGDEVAMFWACGVTPQAVIAEVRLELAITHAPGHMFITDVRDSEIRGRAPAPVGPGPGLDRSNRASTWQGGEQ